MDAKACERCGTTFSCGAKDPDKSCWCVDLPVVTAIPPQYKNCLCPECLKSFLKPEQKNDALKEGVDFYLEKGNMVFTAAYHQKRGECCNSGCRHCPWA